ncbi:hypothetical protein EJ08DRAFT_387606 [Tothia fuscella]|uniref:Uncharacterized protein n=1 Tax=Tothia fuscella TaxID=1048955 RepID=A0A9P4U1U2_9PEZI|nr:hypothetical protein EJ08DRAFT_387606 [Tothia fuscella]
MPLPSMSSLKSMGRRKSGGNSLDAGSSPQAPVSSFRVIPRQQETAPKTNGYEHSIPYNPARQASYDERQNGSGSSSNRGSNSSAATSAHSRIFEAQNTRYSSSSTLQSPTEAFKKSASTNYLGLPDDAEDDDFGNMFAGLGDRRSRLLDESSSYKMPPVAKFRSESEPMLGGNMFAKTKTPPPFRKNSPQPPSPLWGRTSNDGLMSSPTLQESPLSDDNAPPPVPKHAPADLKDFAYLTIKDEMGGEDVKLPLPSRPTLRTQNSFQQEDGDADARIVRESFVSRDKHGFTPSPMGRNQKERSNPNLLNPQIKSVSNMSSDNSLNTASTSSSSSSTAIPVSATSQHTRNVTPVAHPSFVQGSSSANTTPRAGKSKPKRDDDEPLFDESITKAILSATRHTEARAALPSQRRNTATKVMSAAEFKQQQKHRIAAEESDSGNEYEDDEDDPDQIALQRKIREEKEAKHAIWRQAMKKEIGDQSVSTPSGYSTQTPHFSLTGPATAGASASVEDEDEDESTPLGILLAHNFPSKYNPPDPRLSANSFVGVQRPPSQMGGGNPSARPGSSMNKLPPFARRLPGPEDIPYVGGGSNLIQPSDRQSMGMGRLGTQSVYGGSVMEVNPIVPPGGLVGIIAEEERQKAMRRGGSPGNPNNPPPRQSQQQQVQQMTMGMGMPLTSNGGASAPGMPYFNNNLQAQFEQNAFNQQMMSIIQHQQQMMAVLAQNSGFPTPPMPGMNMGMNPMSGMPMSGLPPPQVQQNRPMSMAGVRPPLQQSRTMSMAHDPGRPNMQPRTMSMAGMNYPGMMGNNQYGAGGLGGMGNMGLGMGMNMQQQTPNYTPSIAPSERSNIGQSTRYRPVSTVRGDGGSTITAGSTYNGNGNSQFTTAKLKGVYGSANAANANANAGEDDEEGWSKHAKSRRGGKKT